jgi:hypothetical protein
LRLATDFTKPKAAMCVLYVTYLRHQDDLNQAGIDRAVDMSTLLISNCLDGTDVVVSWMAGLWLSAIH